jgi:hypothetical protein
MGRRIVLVPSNQKEPCKVIDLDNATDEEDTDKDPYAVARSLLNCDTAVIVSTSRHDTYVVLDEDARLKGASLNPRASWRFYPAPLAGDVILMKLKYKSAVGDGDVTIEIEDIGTLMVRHANEGNWDN